MEKLNINNQHKECMLLAAVQLTFLECQSKREPMERKFRVTLFECTKNLHDFIYYCKISVQHLTQN